MPCEYQSGVAAQECNATAAPTTSLLLVQCFDYNIVLVNMLFACPFSCHNMMQAGEERMAQLQAAAALSAKEPNSVEHKLVQTQEEGQVHRIIACRRLVSTVHCSLLMVSIADC